MKRGTLAVVGLIAAACLVGATGGRVTANRQPRVAFVTNSGVVPSKRTLEGQMLAGFLEGDRTLAIQGRVVYLSPTQDPSGTLANLARQKYDLIMVALPRVDIVYAVARRFPGVRFFLVDIPVHGPPHKPRNVQGSIYRAEEAGYLAGYLAGLVEAQRAGRHVVSAVGGFKFEGVTRWLVGYRAGARKADPAVAVQIDYSDDFANPAKCRRVALSQIAKGSGVVFNVAGACGLGALRAAKDKGVWGVGVDVDQSYLGPHILTSAVLRFDKGVVAVLRRLVQKRLGTSGNPVFFDVRNGGVGLGTISPRVQKPLLRRLETIRKAIVAGKIRVPRAT
jgi:basic membrane protein A and related proteins